MVVVLSYTNADNSDITSGCIKIKYSKNYHLFGFKLLVCALYSCNFLLSAGLDRIYALLGNSFCG